MAHFPIVSKYDHPTESTGSRPLPLAYMEDFSILGFRVDDCDRVIRSLRRHGFEVKKREGCTEVEIEGASRVNDVVKLLNGGGMTCEMADVAEGIYQG